MKSLTSDHRVPHLLSLSRFRDQRPAHIPEYSSQAAFAHLGHPAIAYPSGVERVCCGPLWGQLQSLSLLIALGLMLLGALAPGVTLAEEVVVTSNHSAASPSPAQAWRLQITGNQALNEAKLLAAAREELEGFATQNQAASAIDDAAFQMELVYRHAGYPKAVVDYEIKAEAREVLFTVQEGRRLLVAELRLQGNQGVERPRLLALDPVIREALASRRPFPYVVDTLETLVEEIRGLYLAEGYLLVEVQASGPESLAADQGEQVAVTITLREGPRFTVGEVAVQGDRPPEVAAAIAELGRAMQGKVYQRRQRLVLKTGLHDAYENAGYADVAVTVEEELDEEQGRVRLLAQVESGQRFVGGGGSSTGNQRTSPEFIESRLHFKPGARYTLDDKRESFSSLYRTGLFSTVDLTMAAGPLPGQKTAEVKVQERKAREVYVEPGWGSYELLRFKAGYKDSNLLGSGRILRFDSTLSAKGRSLETGVSDPWFLGSEWTVGLPFHYRYRTEPVFTMENSGADLYALRTIHKKVTLNLGYQYSKNVVSDVGPEADLPGLATNYHTASLSCQLTRDTRDDLFFPSTGYRGNVSLAVARPEFGGTISYNRLLTGVRYFVPLAGGSIVGMRFNTGIILPAGEQQSIPVAERFFNGGESSVRSFQASELGPRDESGDPLGGTAFTTYTLEWRRKLSEDVAWSLFVDVGNVSPNRTAADGRSPLVVDAATLTSATWRDYFSDLRSGVGTGVQYMLPVGPARLDVAVNPDRDASRDEPDYALHFSIGMAF